MEYWYFVAPSDDAARSTIDWPQGPLGERDGSRADVVLAEPVEGPQFSQDLAALGALLLNWENDLEDVEHFVVEDDPDAEHTEVILRVPSDLVAALAAIADEDVAPTASDWADAMDEDLEPDEAEDYLAALRELATFAQGNAARVYSYGWI